MIFQNLPALTGNERQYVLDCIDTNWVSSLGRYVDRFETEFSRYCGARHGIACCNGTAAIHLTLAAHGIGFGDEVIVPAFTLIADANMVILSGAKPVFVDVSARHWCLDESKIEEKLTPRTKAILAVHMYGHPCHMDSLKAIAQKHNLILIEDAAEAHGTLYKGRKTGALGHAACFSFYGSKTLTTGEGGMVTTDDEEAATRMRIIRSQGFEGDGRNYTHRIMGFNYRLTNLQAAIGVAQTEQADIKVAAKRRIAAVYREVLADIPGISFQHEEDWATSSYWNSVILIDEAYGKSRDTLMQELHEAGIQTRTAFRNLAEQPVFANSQDPRYPDTTGHYPVASLLSERGLCLPSGVMLTEAEQAQVIDAIRKHRK